MEKPSSENGGRPSKPTACPRCQSSNTKFCYFNNHNVNQPRHFCRDCQRYWTAGGSLRNVPVGAGKRKLHKGTFVNTTKVESLPNILSFSGTHLGQGACSASLDAPPSLLCGKQQVPQDHGLEWTRLGTPPVVSQLAFTDASKPLDMSAPAVSGYVELDASQQHDLRSSSVILEKMGFSDVIKKPTLTLGLALSQEAPVKGTANNLPSHISFTSLHHGTAQHPTQHVTDLDEPTGCSSVIANLGSSASEAFAESNAPCVEVPPFPSVDQAPSVLNPMAAWGASMCRPWLWPFMMSGGSVPPPTGIPPVEPTFAAAMGAAMAGMPPMHPAFMAAMGAMASKGSIPQVDPNVMAALTTGLLQLPHLWNPYAWGFPWNAAWNNMANAGVNVPNGTSRRPPSPIQDQGCWPSKLARKDQQTDVGTSIDGVHAADVSNAQDDVSRPAGYFDVFMAKVGTYLPKDTQLEAGRPEDHSDLHQPPRMNPAAQARSVAFHEGIC